MTHLLSLDNNDKKEGNAHVIITQSIIIFHTEQLKFRNTILNLRKEKRRKNAREGRGERESVRLAK